MINNMPIKTLSKEVAAKIAAGEVVERPISVVKELMENSIDAGADEISIRLEQSGKKSIEVIDNGAGIAINESEVALQRYATSKITHIQDLNHIHTLGFRGEALASIAAVSRFTIESRSESEGVGFVSYIEGGVEKEKRKIGRSVGTKIIVKDLFYNMPARLKFLRKDITERRLIHNVISRYALYYADIHFSLFIDGKSVFSTNGNNNRREVLTKLYDLETAKSLLEVDFSDEYIHIKGFTSPLSLTRSTRREIFFFINGRLIKDPSISSAITKGYHGLLMVGRFPITNLFLNIDPAEIDVNVHPTKAEIRIKDSSQAFIAIQRAIRKTISAYAPYAAIPTSVWRTVEPHQQSSRQSGLVFQPNTHSEEDLSDVENRSEISQLSEVKMPLLRLIGQLGLTYIAAEGPDGLYLIDQHAAHERILFEKLNDSSKNGRSSQYVLTPPIVTISSVQYELIEKNKAILSEIGFKLEDFGPNAYKIIAVPEVLSVMDPVEAVLSIVSDEESTITNSEKEKLITKICKRLAIKGGQVLSVKEQEQLIRDLENCKNPRTCPHGRPTMVHISVDLLERQFGRRGAV